MARINLLDELLEVLKGATIEFVEARIVDYAPQAPHEPRPRRVPKAAKIKTPKTPKPAKRAEPTLYQVLGVDAKAEPEVIEAAWKAKARLYHPDRAKGAQAAEKMKAVNAAHDTLSDPIKRREYDKSIREAR